MIVATKTAQFPYPLERVWNVVTNLQDTAWRTDLSRVEVRSETNFVEYTTSGFATQFTVSALDPMRLWAFDLENIHLAGSWKGTFSGTNSSTTVTFQETVRCKHWWMRPLVPFYLRRQQSLYFADLRRKLDQISH
ncbi:MAG: SRPBCC family protein [Lawsonibacter sp.]|jgi:hypothetical protein